MTKDEFIQCVLSEADPTKQFAAVRNAIARETAFDFGSLSDLDSRMAAIATFKRFQQHILSLLEAPVPSGVLDPAQFAHRRIQLVSDATAVWTSQVKRFRYRQRHRVRRQPFRLENAGAPAYRQAEREAIRLLWAAVTSEPVADGRTFDFADVEPFVDHRVSHRVRAAQSLCWLEPGRIKPHHLRDPREQSLVGQQGIFARIDIPAGTCVGVYGGQFMDEADVFLVKDDRYLLGVSTTRPGVHAINGENLLSLSNTVYEYDTNGRPCGHPQTGHDLLRATFRVRFSNDWTVGIPAFFAARDIPAGTELRWNYMLQRV